MEIETSKKDVGMSWEMVRLGDVATFVNGYPFKPTDWGIEGYEIIRIQNLTKGTSESNYFSGSIPEKFKVTDGDVLISWSATLDIFVWKGNDAWLNQHIFKVVFDKIEIDKSYFIYAIKNILDEMRKQVHGATMQHITKGKFDNLQIPLPPLATQKRIAEILDAADALRRKDQELLKKYDELAQAIFIDMFGDPVKNEKGWETKALKIVTTKIGSGATPTGGKTAYKSEGISLIRSMNVYDFSFKWKDLAFIDETQAAKLDNVTVQSRDVLFNITGASVCRCSIVPDELLPARVNQHVAIIRAKRDFLNPIFLNHLLVSNSVKTKLLGVGAGGGAVMEAITKDQLEQFEIIVPPLKLQDRFEQLIDNIFTQKRTKINSNEDSERLFNSLIQKAFKGELV